MVVSVQDSGGSSLLRAVAVLTFVTLSATTFGYSTFDPRQQGEFNDFWDTRTYVAAVPVTASGVSTQALYAKSHMQATETTSTLERAFKTSGIAEIAIKIKRYAAKGLSFFIR